MILWRPKRYREMEKPEDQHLLPKGEAVLKQTLAKWGKLWRGGRFVSDRVGTFAFFGFIEGTLWRFYLIARKEPYGNIVSAGLDILQEASNDRVSLLMYLDSQQRVYVVKPSEIIGHPNTMISHRGGSPYYDFDVMLLKPFEDFLRSVFGPSLNELPSGLAW